MIDFPSEHSSNDLDRDKKSVNQFEFHHLGVAVRNLSTAIPVYRNLFGYELISGPFDDPIQDVSVGFLSRSAGDPVMELVAPLGPNSPIRGRLKMGGGVYHVCYQVPSLQSAIMHLREQGSLLLTEPKPAVAFGMREIAWLLTETDMLVELLQESDDANHHE